MSNQNVNYAVHWAVYWDVSGAVRGAVDRAVDNVVWLAVSWAGEEDPPHPGLQDFLLELKGSQGST